MPGEYGLEGDDCPNCVTEDIEGLLESSWYVEERSGCDSTALVATEVRGACRLWFTGI